MKMNRLYPKMLSLLTFTVLLCVSGSAQLDDLLKRAETKMSGPGSSSLSDDKIVAGLKEALQVSTGKAVASTGRPDGFLKNEAIKILLPPKLKTVGSGLRMIGELGALHAATRKTDEERCAERPSACRAKTAKMTHGDSSRVRNGAPFVRATVAAQRPNRKNGNDRISPRLLT